MRHEFRIHDLALSYTLPCRLNETVQTVPPALQVRHLKVPSSEYETPSQVVVFPILERTILLGLKGIREILDCRLEKRYIFSGVLSAPPSGVGRRGGKGFPFKIELSPSPKDQHFSPELRLANTTGDKRYLSYDPTISQASVWSNVKRKAHRLIITRAVSIDIFSPVLEGPLL